MNLIKYRNIASLTPFVSSTAQTWIQTWGYDRYGNRTAFSQNIGGQQLQTDSLNLPTIDAVSNRIAANQGYTFDKNGNVTTDPANGGRQFIFDGDNKQTEVKDASGITIGRYFYDGEGKRVKKVTDLETTVFVYSAGKLVAEYSTATPPTNPTINYTATDQIGSPRAITDKFGQIVSRRDFMPFGEELYADGQNRTTENKYTPSGQDDVRQRFTGYQKDLETGLDFAEARYYNNQHGRFTAVDPLLASGKSSNPQTFNRYAYVLDNPLVLIDPSGMQAGVALVPDRKCGSNCWGTSDGKGTVTANKSLGTVQSEPYEPTPVEMLSSGFNQGIADVQSGSWKGAANTAIDALNAATGLALNSQGGVYIPSSRPNPFAIERFPVYSETEARWSVGVELGLTAAPAAFTAPFATTSSLSVVPEASQISNTVTVGRWMGHAEFSAMQRTGMVQESSSGATHVAFPANPNTFIGPAKPGSLYVEFGVPRPSVVPTGGGYARIATANSIDARLAARLGRPLPETPPASNPFCSICRTNIQ